MPMSAYVLQLTPTNANWGKKASMGEDRQEENEEIQRGNQGPRNLAYDEANDSRDVEDDRASH